jgi:cytosine/adenosine deaminase-related metal-dependent hydrolase
MTGPPIRDGWVAVEAGRILAVGGADRIADVDAVPDAELKFRALLSESRSPNPEPPAYARSVQTRFGEASPQHVADSTPTREGGRIAILPGLVNAHTHLELSWMRGRIGPGDAMPGWAARVIALGQERGTSAPRQVRESIVDAIAEARMSGTSLVGDITNSLASWEPLAASDLSAAVFLELIGFNAADSQSVVSDAETQLTRLAPSGGLRPSIVPHAPYSVSPDLFRAIAAASSNRTVSIHLGESPEEIRFLQDGTGPWRELLEQVGAWNPDWAPPACGPVEYLARLGLLDDRLLAVHAVQLSDGELWRLAEARATVVTCPRSNRWTGAGVPPVERFYAAGVNVAIGTDSLASVEDLNMFAEMAAVRRLAPTIPARDILHSATQAGARALTFGHDLGSIEPGKRADLLAVHIPTGVEDVEEYLVGGITASDCWWIDD